MPSFPFLKLPKLPQLLVLKSSNLDDFFVFSLASKRAKDIAIDVRRNLEECYWTLDRPSPLPSHWISLCPELVLYFPLFGSMENAKNMKWLEEWKLNEQVLPVIRSMGSHHIYIGEPEKEKEYYYDLMDQFSKHILEVFRCTNFSFSSDSYSEELFVFKHSRKFEEVRYCIESVPSNHMKFALENLEITKELNVEEPVPGFSWSGPLRMEVLIVEHADWVTFEALMSMECVEVRLSQHTFSKAQMKAFVRKWISGGFPNLEYCSLKTGRCLRVLRGIETMPYNPTNRPEEHPRGFEDLSGGRDIRSNDGVLATIKYHRGDLTLGVWNDI